MAGGGAGQHRPDQARLEVGHQPHCLERRAAQSGKVGLVTIGREQPLVRDARRLDFGVARQDRGVGDAEPLGGLALGEQEIVHALLAHDARGFLGHRRPQQFGAWVRSSMHRPPLQKIGSSGAVACTLSASTDSSS